MTYEEMVKRETDEAKLMNDWARSMQNVVGEHTGRSLNMERVIDGACQIEDCPNTYGYRGGEPGYCWIHQKNIESWRSARRERLGLVA